MVKIVIKDENSSCSLILGEIMNSEWEFSSFLGLNSVFKNMSLLKYQGVFQAPSFSDNRKVDIFPLTLEQ